jgi:hypothetical protein
MADFIRREDALKALYNDYAYAAMDVIKRLPAADVAEVVYGRWILHHTVTGNPYTECSNCCTDFAFKTDKGTFAKLDMRDMPYCPFCSAKMDGGSNGE